MNIFVSFWTLNLNSVNQHKLKLCRVVFWFDWYLCNVICAS